jgi:hypothetical protein
VNIKVVDPLRVQPGKFTMEFSGVNANATWVIKDSVGNVVANSAGSISFLVEQIIPELGISVDVRNQPSPGGDVENTRNQGIISSGIEYEDPT